jgi:hypothetical protein
VLGVRAFQLQHKPNTLVKKTSLVDWSEEDWTKFYDLIGLEFSDPNMNLDRPNRMKKVYGYT